MLIKDTIVIDAPVARVWDMTMDIGTWPSISPTMQRVERLDEGELRIGSSARIKQPGQPAAVWTVTRLEPMRAFVWYARRPGVTMTGGHLLEDLGGGRCRYTLTLEVTGPMSGPTGLLFGGVMRKALATENAGFKRAAEAARSAA
jgi:uncharacterized membrane protein